MQLHGTQSILVTYCLEKFKIELQLVQQTKNTLDNMASPTVWALTLVLILTGLYVSIFKVLTEKYSA